VTNQQLVEKLISDKTLTTPRIIDAFRSIDRKDFVLPGDEGRAYEDRPLSMGYGATISQPTTVAIMLEKLFADGGSPIRGKATLRALAASNGVKILEIGTGSGYMTALLAELIAKKGKVFSIELIPELKGLAEFNLKKYNFRNVCLFVDDGKAGLENYAPFDRIISSASGDETPKSWKNQLKIGGRIVAPVAESLIVLDKTSKRRFKEKEYTGFIFVALR